jgi:NAD-dependent SIR2 family protein deacetylase
MNTNINNNNTNTPPNPNKINSLKNLITSCKKIIVMCGAGVSTAAGIPDFRTPGTGLYSQLANYGLKRPEDIFTISFFKQNPQPFYRLCKEIWPSNYAPTKTHHFIKLLADKKKLLRCFTQNIDSLESLAGLDTDMIVAAHGNFDTASCCETKIQVPIQEVEQVIRQSGTGGNPSFVELNKKYGTKLVKPDIVFFGENLPKRFFDHMKDFQQCDLLIVMGTSLQVHPFAGLVDRVPRNTKRVLINRELVGTFDLNSDRDLFISGDCDVIIDTLADTLGWGNELKHAYLECKEKITGKVSVPMTS